MNTPRWRLIEEHFSAALALPAAERAAYIERLPPELRDEVASLLKANEESATFLERTAASSAAEPPRQNPLEPGARVGVWRIGRIIGYGGMGEVYEVHRADGQFEQRAALKLVRPQAAQFLDRFNAERQILARLDHPGIARLLDGGIAPDGRPYAVMEYVEGEPITSYCDRKRASLRERLALFLQVCDAVAHAHLNLIVHRDIKPGNVLVGADGRTRLLDFGIAKPLDPGVLPPGPETTAALLTPDYAAPEQLAGEPVTTATDVFALGVLLFELLAGQRPWASRPRSLAQIVSVALDVPAPLASEAAREAKYPRVPPRLLQGDLDAIIAKCLRREPQHRYATVNALKLDIERSMRGDPVLAREDARLYVFGRFLRRYRWVAASVAAVVASLAVGLVGTLWQAQRAELERDIAQRAASREEAVRSHLVRLFRAAVEQPGNEPVTAKTMLDRSARRVIEQYKDDPHLAGKVVVTLADLYGALGDIEAQAPLLEQFLAASADEDPGAVDPVAIAIARHKLAGIEVMRGNLDRAEPLLQQAEAFWASAPDRYREQRLEAALIRGQLQRARGDLEGAIRTLQAAVAERIKISGHDHRETATLYNSLAISLAAVNRFDEALAAWRESLDILERLGRGGESDYLVMLANTGTLAFRTGRIAEAEQILKSAAEKQEALAGVSPAVAAATGLYGAALAMRATNARDALPVLRRAVKMAEEQGGEASPLAVQNRLFLGEALCAARDFAAARAVNERNLAIARERFGEANLMTLRIRLALTRVGILSGERQDFRSALRDIVAGLRKLGPPGQTSLAGALILQGETLVAASKAEEAIPVFEEAVHLRERLLWSGSWELAEARARLGEARLAVDDSTGTKLLRDAARTLAAQLGESHPQTLRATRALAMVSNR